ncbi:ribosome small subunit-dependent GTPase A [Bacillus alveayuensis]|jgi:ribosome biogenesis GTPase|uniref:Small ribosomal subunit biogenesis GTPase RsgA n=1 Tax=Aeribacillus alveayuensis TaxID=279215 RepID=A0ABT9VL46_9BACI|nr:ribosome small subunit-dependent GTPase A [Bacillus alveayuensis]MDQ0161692.1 ribosome biogenesis GTPase [Bacillus alveayuensis]
MPQGKIMKALSGFYYVSDGEKLIQCRSRGVFRKHKITPLVGDNVEYQAENEKEGYILEIFERKNELIRPPIANIDLAILVFSAVEPEFSPALLDRFLVLIEAHDITPIICISKIDLLNDEEEKKHIDQYVENYRKIGYDVFLISSKKPETVHALFPVLKNKISVVAGQSGVGKSSLLNCLKPDLKLKTSHISPHLGRGKHTTRHVELIEIAGGLVADTPGFSSLEFINIEATELSQYFPEMRELSPNCKFRGCTHIKEPKCAVKMALEGGKIPDFRYEHYLHFFEEIKDRKPRY